MKLKGLSDTIKAMEELIKTVNDLIDSNDEKEETDRTMARDEMLNDAWNMIESAKEELSGITDLSIDSYL